MIIQFGRDVTKRVDDVVAEQQATERRGFYIAVMYLMLAKSVLNRTPRPWQNDCVSASIDAIDALIKELR